MVKRTPHHPLAATKSKFSTAATLEITRTAFRSAADLGYCIEEIVGVVQSLEPADFVKSETAHNPPNARVWHYSYRTPADGMWLYLKFAGETLVDVALVSFKEA
ncbi:MAG: type II toxin-antitoxin system MqsR family toxin [Sphingomonadaceae bacterium]|nr:type II toxin-antitoxin system MqsR family toxin [Sphingomonadaceae bacterium]